MMFQGHFIDGFAGAGGASTGIAQAIGRDVDIAINHSPTAIAIHKANHPGTEHFCQDIRAVWPKAATKLQPVMGAWFSPDCKEYSKAKGGPVKDRHIRALSDEVEVWLKEVQPVVAYLENVEEYETAGPLDEDGREIKELRGKPFKRRVSRWRRLGYRVQWRKLRACDYGAPTSRRRLYVIMRRDALPIVWPKPTHGRPDSAGVLSGKLLPYRTAAECIDWSIPCPSIFDRARDLADATNRRIAHGVMRYVVNAARPFIVGTAFNNTRASRVFDPVDPLRTVTTQNEYGVVDVEAAAIAPLQNGERRAGEKPREQSVADPLSTIATGGKFAAIGATLIGVGGRRGQSPPMPIDGTYPTTTAKADAAIATVALAEAAFIDRQFGNSAGNDAELPLGATMAGGGGKSAAVTAWLSSFYGSDKAASGGDPEKPLRTARAGGQHHAVAAAHMAQFNTNPGGSVNPGHAMHEQVSTIATRGPHQGVVETTLIEEGALPPAMMERAVKVAAFLVKYYGEGGQHQAADRPLDVVTTRARYAVVTVTIDAVTYVIVDIGLRMLKPRELARAQGFPENYVLDPIVRKFLRGKWVERRLTIAEQISAIGNSVCPPVARALVAANQPGIPDMAVAA